MSERSKITVGLFFGKKDDNLLWYLYQLVSSADFNFIVKATLKYHLKNDKFKIHYFADLTPLIEEDISDEVSGQQRNIIFSNSDGELYDWIKSKPMHLRPLKIKQLVTERLIECCEIVKNGEEVQQEEPIQPYPYVFIQNQPPMNYQQFIQGNMMAIPISPSVQQPHPSISTMKQEPVPSAKLQLDPESKEALLGNSSILSYGKMGAE